jgi:N-acetylglucosaminyl-diphospho-decaprenol L-rhamnosyltransferase
MNAVELSICIVNWNRRELLRDLLISLQTECAAMAAEIIVVDNASTDGSAEMVAAGFPKVILARNDENRGFSKANNQAVARSHGRLVLFLNNDTVVRPDALRRMVQLMDERPDIVAVGPRLTNAHGQARERYMCLPTLPALLDRVRFLHWTRLFRAPYRRFRRGRFDAAISQPVEQVPGSAIMARRAQFLGCGAWDEGFGFGCEDFDLSARLKRLGILYYLATAEIVHLGGQSSQENAGFVYRHYENGAARYLRKHSRWRGASWVYKICVTLDMPARLATLAARYALTRLKGEKARAARLQHRLKATGDFYFLHLFHFWRC